MMTCSDHNPHTGNRCTEGMGHYGDHMRKNKSHQVIERWRNVRGERPMGLEEPTSVPVVPDFSMDTPQDTTPDTSPDTSTPDTFDGGESGGGGGGAEF